MARPLWFVELLKQGFPGRFLIARLTKMPVIGKVIDRWLFEGDDIIYLPKDQVIRVNKPVDVPEQMVLPSQVVGGTGFEPVTSAMSTQRSNH